MFDTVPNTVPTGKTKAASILALPLSNAGALGATRTHDLRFRNTASAPDIEERTTIYGVRTRNKTDVLGHRVTSSDVGTVPHTVPARGAA